MSVRLYPGRRDQRERIEPVWNGQRSDELLAQQRVNALAWISASAMIPFAVLVGT